MGAVGRNFDALMTDLRRARMSPEEFAESQRKLEASRQKGPGRFADAIKSIEHRGQHAMDAQLTGNVVSASAERAAREDEDDTVDVETTYRKRVRRGSKEFTDYMRQRNGLGPLPDSSGLRLRNENVGAESGAQQPKFPGMFI